MTSPSFGFCNLHNESHGFFHRRHRAAVLFYLLLSRCRLWDDDSISFRFKLTAVDVDSNSMWDEAMPTLLLFSGGIARERKNRRRRGGGMRREGSNSLLRPSLPRYTLPISCSLQQYAPLRYRNRPFRVPVMESLPHPLRRHRGQLP